MNDDSEEYLGYPSYDNYIDCYMWLELIPFNRFDYLNELHIMESGNIFGNLFGNPILDMEDFILEVTIPEDENIFRNLFGNYILGDENWDEDLELANNHSHGFYRFLFGYGFIHSQEQYDEVFGIISCLPLKCIQNSNIKTQYLNLDYEINLHCFMFGM